jgi:hypothetical protein
MTAATTTLAPGSGLARGQDQDVLQVDVGDAVGQRGEAREDQGGDDELAPAILPPALKSIGVYALYLAVVFVRPQGLFGRL